MFNFLKGIPTISTSELSERLSKDIKLLDVRSPAEYRSGHIAKAVNVPLNKIDTYNGKEKQVYVICQSGMRSKKAAKVLSKKGYEVTNVRGGMSQWNGKVRGGK